MDLVVNQKAFFGSPASTVAAWPQNIVDSGDKRKKQIIRFPLTTICKEQGEAVPDALSGVHSNEANLFANPTASTPLPLPPSRSRFPSSLKFLRFSKHEDNPSRNENSCTLQPHFHRPENEEHCALDQSEKCSKFEESEGKGQFDWTKPDSPSSEIAQTIGDTQENAHKKRGWIENLLHFSSFRKDSSSHTSAQRCSQPYVCNDCAKRTLAELDNLQNIVVVGENNSYEAEQSASERSSCSLQDLNSSVCLSSLELPYVPVVHDQESFSQYLQAVPLTHLKHMAKMCYLCNLAYKIKDINPDKLYQSHRLTYITSSLERKAKSLAKDGANEKLPPAAIPISSLTKNSKDYCENEAKLRFTRSPAMACSSTSEATADLHSQTKKSLLPEQSQSAYNDADKNEIPENVRQDDNNVPLTFSNSGLDSCTHPTDVTFEANLINNSAKIILPNVPSIGSNDMELQSSDLAASLPTTGTPEEPEQTFGKDSLSLHKCPCEWFCCEHKEKHIRYFVIQGSESLASWQTNLLFEPVVFEDSGLGVLVHRGIYDAAKGLYEQLVPDMLEYIQIQGDQGLIQLTGHSLGGSLATLLSIMLQIRGVIASSSLLPVVTFGSPCIMCGGDYLLDKLGLPEYHIQSIVMHRDIVPRTFACEYPQHVVEVLKRLNGTFRDHPCLMHQKLLYAPMGQYFILQPDQEQAPPHPFLPSDSGIYLLKTLGSKDRTVSDLQLSDQKIALRAAQRAFFNAPHPLEILSDPSAYGPGGSISRDHDSRSYIKALGGVLRLELKRLRHINRQQRRQVSWPLVASKVPPTEVRSLDATIYHASSEDLSAPSASEYWRADAAVN